MTFGELEMVIFENFEEALPLMVTHRMRLLLGGRDALLRPREKLCDAMRGDEGRVIVVDFAREAETASICGSSLVSESEASGASSGEASVSSIWEAQEDFLQFRFFLE